MNKIRFTADKDTNYVYHMLSVAKCGYDNDYGSKYRSLYPADELALIKQQEYLLTVTGGEHCGLLYGTLVSEPACARLPAKEYYAELIRMADNCEVPPQFTEYTDIVCDISRVMIKHYDHYINNIWKHEEQKLREYIPEVLRLFEQSQFTDKAEEAVGCALMSKYFTATLVTSVANGADAIDISTEQDLFGIDRDPVDAFYFIGHEYIIYLLLNALKDENAFKELSTWNLTEGLADYYLKKILGSTRFFDSHRKYAEFFESCENSTCLSAAELYRMGLQADI